MYARHHKPQAHRRHPRRRRADNGIGTLRDRVDETHRTAEVMGGRSGKLTKQAVARLLSIGPGGRGRHGVPTLPDGERQFEVCGLTVLRCGSTVVIPPYFYNVFNFLDIYIWCSFAVIIVLHIVHVVRARRLALDSTGFVNTFSLFHVIDTKLDLIAVNLLFCWIKILE